VSGISSQEAVGAEEDQKEGRLGAGQDAKTRDQNLKADPWRSSCESCISESSNQCNECQSQENLILIIQTHHIQY